MSELSSAPSPVISTPTWAEFWPEAKPLAELHYDEVDGGVEPRRKMNVDTEQMALFSLMGGLRIWAAHRLAAGPLLGYILWTVQRDPESAGLLVAHMGPWFVLPGNPGLGSRLFDESISGLKALGVQCCFPHHRLQGRGAHLERFFAARGAKPIQKTFSLWIGEP